MTASIDRRRAVALLALLSAAVLVPWTAGLASLLPSTYLVTNWSLTWVGFDVALLLALGAAGVASLRRHPAAPGLLAVAASLLLCDAWFDVTTAASTSDLVASAAAALLVELPLAVLLAREGRRQSRAAAAGAGSAIHEA